MYGFGAATDAAMRLPILRQMLGWLSAGTAGRGALTEGLAVRGQNLFIMPGGVAEIFLSQPGAHVVKARRYGLMKLALRTGACLVPVYVFGGNDFYRQLAGVKHARQSGEGCSVGRWDLLWSRSLEALGIFQERISRTVRAGITVWWGRCGTPMPFPARCAMVLGDPIETVPGTFGEETVAGKLVCRRVPEPTDKQVEELLIRYTDALCRLFDQYKAPAGCPNAELKIL